MFLCQMTPRAVIESIAQMTPKAVIESIDPRTSLDMQKAIVRSVVDDCSPIHWDINLMIVKLRELSLVVHPDKCSHANATRCFAAVMDVRRKLLKLGKVDHLWSLKSREVFYSLGCCPEHLLYSNRLTSFPKFQTFNQFIWLLRGPHSFDIQSIDTALSVIRKEPLTESNQTMSSQMTPRAVIESIAPLSQIMRDALSCSMSPLASSQEDFHVETVFLVGRAISHWVISQVSTETKKRALYAKAANLSYVATLPSLEDRRKYTERMVAGVADILQALNVSGLPKLPTWKSFEIMNRYSSEMRISENTPTQLNCDETSRSFPTKQKAQAPIVPDAKRKKLDTTRDPRRVTVRVPDAKLTSRFYEMACDFAKDNPNEWHPRSAFTIDLSEKEYHSMRGSFIMKKSTGKDADYFPRVDYTCAERNSFLMTHLGKGTPVHFRWNT